MVTANGTTESIDINYSTDVDISKLMISSDDAGTASPKHKRSTKPANPLDSGFPGFLTKEEVEVYVRLLSWVPLSFFFKTGTYGHLFISSV